MSFLQVTASRPSLHIPDQYNTPHGLAVQRIAPVNIFNLHNSLKPTVGSSKKFTELITRHMIQRTGASRYQLCKPVCLFGGKGGPRSGNEASPWKSIEKAMSGLKKEQSLEDVLRKQMEKQDYYDDGSGEDPPIGGGDGGGGGGGSGGFRGTGDEGFDGMWDDIQQVTFAILALIAMYVYIVMGDRVITFIAEGFEFLAGKRGPRLRTIMQEFAQFYETYRAKVKVDPYWLEKAIISTPTWWDSPRKYRRALRPQIRAIMSSSSLDSDNDDNDKDSDDENTYRKVSDDRNRYHKKTYSDDDNDNGAYSEDDDDY
ncbi:uncharacterized protein LOC112507298 [Cynara cardunculus var. scolymus]|nr:uncharacterized protein LOC112507298 [Cynara cardunculus var. scolymus]